MRGLHPYTKFIIVFVISGFSVLLDKPGALLVLTILAIILFLGAKPSGSWIKGFLFISLTTTWGIMISQALFYQIFPRTILFCIVPPSETFSGLCFIKEGFIYGLIQSLRLVATLAAGAYLINSTSTEMLFRAVSAIPMPRGLSLMVVASVRALPQLARDIRLLRQALKLRSYRPLRCGIMHTLRTEFSVFYPLLTRAVRDSRAFSDTLLTRGFNPLSPGKALFLPPWSKAEKIFCLIILGLFLAIFCGKILFWAYIQGVFYAEKLRPLYALFRNYL